MGGMHGMGPIDAEPNEPVFHHEWEKRVLALALATGFLRRWNIDMGRYTIEQMPAPEYLRATYYEKWLHRTERLLVERGLLTAEEMASGRPNGRPPEVKALPPAEVHTALRGRRAARMDDGLKAPQFKAGDRVRTRNVHPMHHTRLPRYARGKRAVIAAHRGCHVFPDTNAHHRGEQPQHVYGVRFDARELWREAAEPNAPVYLDLWESYLLPA
jgi:nitrile hydratase subunit beta